MPLKPGHVLSFLTLACATSLANAQSDRQRQIEEQYRITCAPQAIANSPFLREQCRQLRAQIDALNRAGAGRGSGPSDDDEDDEPAPPPASTGGAIGDPGALGPQRAYEDQCLRKTPRTAAERAQCERMRQLGYAGATGSRASSSGSQGRAAAPAPASGTPVDSAGNDCVQPTERKTSRWGSANANVDIHFYFRNGCNAPMFVSGTLSRNDGPDAPTGTQLCPGETRKITCSSFQGKGCTELAGYTFRHYPEGATSCR